jgi:hypothetical protein
MKKLIVLSVIFALIAGGAFAVDLSGTVIGTVNVAEGSTGKVADVGSTDFKAPDVGSSGGLNRARIEGSGGNDEGTFGGWVRAEAGGMQGIGWWKPLDLLKISFGGNPDGMYGKEGVTGWGFYQTVYDTGVVVGNNVWGWGPGGAASNNYGQTLIFRDAFFGGFGGQGLMLELTPVDMFGLTIVVPFVNGKTEDVLKQTIVQANLNLDFGTIALTYRGGLGKLGKDLALAKPEDDMFDIFGYGFSTNYNELHWDQGEIGGGDIDDPDGTWTDYASVLYPHRGTDEIVTSYGARNASPGKVFLYFGLTAIENLGIDVGFSYTMAVENEVGADKITYQAPMAAGLGVKYDGGSFGVKFRAVGSFAGKATLESTGSKDTLNEPLKVLADVMPYFVINDKVSAFISVGVGYSGESEVETGGGKAKIESTLGWHVNPYITIGEEWGPKFVVGFKLWSTAQKDERVSVKGTLYGTPTDKYSTITANMGEGSTYIQWALPIALMFSF